MELGLTPPQSQRQDSKISFWKQHWRKRSRTLILQPGATFLCQGQYNSEDSLKIWTNIIFVTEDFWKIHSVS